MNAEAWSLLSCVLILAASITAQALRLDREAGLKYGLSSREDLPTLSPLYGRLTRNVANQVEGMALFAPMVLIAMTTDRTNVGTAAAAVAYAFFRAVYACAYAADVTPWRSVYWLAGMVSLVVFVLSFLLAY